ncbi:MAG: ribosomal protein S18-alanine N-acetyltransferase [Ruminiclostridium sp.]|nr:ribosomal protein S18-alanine N-acetyltransferase [Ruminiclostridium sp.]
MNLENCGTDNLTDSKKDIEYYSEIIAELEKECFPEDPWSRESVESSLKREDILYLVNFVDGKAMGYFLAAASYGTAELYRIAVLPTFRGQGKGEQLMKSFLRYLPKDTEKVYLEVRESNKAAIGLYEKCGFQKIGERKNYYKNENGLIYILNV